MKRSYNIDNYRIAVLEELKRTGNFYNTEIITLTSNNKQFSYHRWLHPYQGSWEVDSVFGSIYLNNLSNILDKDSVVLDIGAQAGYMSVAYALLSKHVYSFEPNPAAFEVLRLNSEIHTNITPFNLAVTETEGPLEFHYSDTGFCNGGFATNTKRGIGVTGHVVPIDVYGVNLLSFVEQQQIDLSNLKLIKIDAEGYDKNILRSIEPMVLKYKPIIITEIYDGLDSTEVQELLDVIHSMGYKAYDENINKLDLMNLGKEINSLHDLVIGSGHNLVCIYDSK